MIKALYTTGLCTRVIDPRYWNDEDLVLSEKEFTKKSCKDHSGYELEEDIESEELLRIIEYLENDFDCKYGKTGSFMKPKKIESSRKSKVNEKRKLIERYLMVFPQYSIKKISGLASCAINTVRSVRDEISIRGQLKEYDYNHLHSEQELNQLDQSIDNPRNIYFSTTDIKRMNPKFSKKAISRRLKKKGYKWMKMPKRKAKQKFSDPDPDEIYRVICNVLNGLFIEDNEVLFMDEFKLPLNQTPEGRWVLLDEDEHLYNDRPNVKKFNVIVLCSIRNYEAFQIYTSEITAKDFLYFMQESLSRLPTGKNYRVLLDNAGWHLANLLQDCDIQRFLLFNVPYVFQLNLIENSFSSLRNGFRRRPNVDRDNEEIYSIAELFRPEKHEVQFRGYYKNYLRTLKKYLMER